MTITQSFIDRITITFNSDTLVESISKVHKNNYWIIELKQINEDTYRLIGEKIITNPCVQITKSSNMPSN